MAFFMEVFKLSEENLVEQIKKLDVENNPFAVFPKPLIEKALEVIEDFAEDIKLD